MDTTIREAFKDAARSVLRESGFPDIETLDMGSSTEAPAEIIAMIGLVGELRGHFVAAFSDGSGARFVRELSSKLGMPEDHGPDHSYRKAALGEIANQISGRAAAGLSELGMDVNLTPPTLISGAAVSAALPEENDRTIFTVRGSFGEFSCFLALKSAKII